MFSHDGMFICEHDDLQPCPNCGDWICAACDDWRRHHSLGAKLGRVWRKHVSRWFIR